MGKGDCTPPLPTSMVLFLSHLTPAESRAGTATAVQHANGAPSGRGPQHPPPTAPLSVRQWLPIVCQDGAPQGLASRALDRLGAGTGPDCSGAWVRSGGGPRHGFAAASLARDPRRGCRGALPNGPPSGRGDADGGADAGGGEGTPPGLCTGCHAWCAGKKVDSSAEWPPTTTNQGAARPIGRQPGRGWPPRLCAHGPPPLCIPRLSVDRQVYASMNLADIERSRIRWKRSQARTRAFVWAQCQSVLFKLAFCPRRETRGWMLHRPSAGTPRDAASASFPHANCSARAVRRAVRRASFYKLRPAPPTVKTKKLASQHLV